MPGTDFHLQMMPGADFHLQKSSWRRDSFTTGTTTKQSAVVGGEEQE